MSVGPSATALLKTRARAMREVKIDLASMSSCSRFCVQGQGCFAGRECHLIGQMEAGQRSENPKYRFWKRAIGFSTALVILPWMFGLGGTVIGMLGAFSTLSETGGADPALLASDISTATSTTAIGLVFSAIGWVCLIVSIVKFKNLPRH